MLSFRYLHMCPDVTAKPQAVFQNVLSVIIMGKHELAKGTGTLCAKDGLDREKDICGRRVLSYASIKLLKQP